ncbi:glycosyltransferase family 2 protein [Rubellicoccus peritrichatus]|uniref:Glycosyltransferase family 2 protein n=1 Tax=Rubellicoccus peritrichatus TaxID=3080537 RepID=A0AAQ3LET8_9BACT|nr:glycosyltransferase family 2 protein [Puniceicoccus sp. CR14]WOO42328.1 glycosyltransferase family 2 protein [Puniceicoccus sp. CR14]
MTSDSHVVVIPSYNTGRILVDTIREALKHWQPVWLFVDGSTDDSFRCFLDSPEDWPGLSVFVSSENEGKGATAIRAAKEAEHAGFTHMLLMDADGQHPAKEIARFMGLSRSAPEAMILGQPVYGDDAPWVRLAGRQLSVGMVWLETLGGGVGDPLVGFRVYPVKALLEAADNTRFARRYDFDPEMAVRLFWRGTRPIRARISVIYVSPEAGGISHFHYLRDNLFMIWLHLRLIIAFIPKCIRVAQLSRHFRSLEKAGS